MNDYVNCKFDSWHLNCRIRDILYPDNVFYPSVETYNFQWY